MPDALGKTMLIALIIFGRRKTRDVSLVEDCECFLMRVICSSMLTNLEFCFASVFCRYRRIHKEKLMTSAVF